MIETHCSDELRDARLAIRERLESNPAERDRGPMRPGMYHPTCERLRLDTARPLEDLVDESLNHVRSLAKAQSEIRNPKSEIGAAGQGMGP
jgi:hypothetical protein